MMKLSNRIITINRTPIFFGSEVFSSIDHYINTLSPCGIYLLADVNTVKHCLPLLLEKSTSLRNAQVIVFNGGEAAKSIENAEMLWHRLLSARAGRKSLLINLGGGVVSDLGGFVAAGYQRGINYINIPTSLMGQVDAAIGGKTAVNFNGMKNQIGFFHAAGGVFIYPGFLKTLPVMHLRSGLAEIIKSLLISDASGWRKLMRQPVDKLILQPVDSVLWLRLIAGAIKFKNRVVIQDYREKKLRKVLNFGHSIGHAFEGHAQSGAEHALLHGDAVAAGMICASYLSHTKTGLELVDMKAIATYLANGFSPFPIDEASIPAIMEYLMHDKKNNGEQFQFTLLSAPGRPVINKSCREEDIYAAIGYYNEILIRV